MFMRPARRPAGVLLMFEWRRRGMRRRRIKGAAVLTPPPPSPHPRHHLDCLPRLHSLPPPPSLSHSRHLNPLSSPLLFICCHSPPSSQAMFSSLCPCPRCSFTPSPTPTLTPTSPSLCLYLTSFAVIGQVSCVHPPSFPPSLPPCLPPSFTNGVIAAFFPPGRRD